MSGRHRDARFASSASYKPSSRPRTSFASYQPSSRPSTSPALLSAPSVLPFTLESSLLVKLSAHTPPKRSLLNRSPHLALHAFGQRPVSRSSGRRSPSPWSAPRSDSPSRSPLQAAHPGHQALLPPPTRNYGWSRPASPRCIAEAESATASEANPGFICHVQLMPDGRSVRETGAAPAGPSSRLPVSGGEHHAGHPGGSPRGSWAERRGSCKPTYKARFARMRWALLRQKLPELLEAERDKHGNTTWRRALSHMRYARLVYAWPRHAQHHCTRRTYPLHQALHSHDRFARLAHPTTLPLDTLPPYPPLPHHFTPSPPYHLTSSLPDHLTPLPPDHFTT